MRTWKHVIWRCKVYSIATVRTMTWEGIEFGNFILVAAIYYWNQLIETSVSSSPLGCNFVTSLISWNKRTKWLPDWTFASYAFEDTEFLGLNGLQTATCFLFSLLQICCWPELRDLVENYVLSCCLLSQQRSLLQLGLDNSNTRGK